MHEASFFNILLKCRFVCGKQIRKAAIIMRSTIYKAPAMWTHAHWQFCPDAYMRK